MHAMYNTSDCRANKKQVEMGEVLDFWITFFLIHLGQGRHLLNLEVGKHP